MRPIALDRFNALVKQTEIYGRLPFSDAWNATAKAHPNLSILVAACGATPARVAFVNESIATKSAKPDKASLSADLHTKIRELMQKLGCNYQTAWNRVARTHPLFANDDVAAVQAAASGSGGVPPLTTALANIFRIPPDTDPETWGRIWSANGGTASAVNFGKCFQACCDVAQGQGAGAVEDAIPVAKKKFPELWAAVEELAKLSF